MSGAEKEMPPSADASGESGGKLQSASGPSSGASAEDAPLGRAPVERFAAEFSAADYARFVIPSLIGILMFLVPIRFRGDVNIGMGILSDLVAGALAGWLPAIVTAVVCLSALVTLYAKLTRPAPSVDAGKFWRIFTVGWPTLLVRVVAAVFAVMVLFQRGPGWVIADATGGVMLGDLMPVILVLFVFAALLLPFLTDFGLMELVGTLVRRAFRALFRLPGRSSIDAVASWMGSAPVGVIITTMQYEAGFYTQREAAVIATNFSIVSVAFTVVIINFVDLGEMFLPYYGTIIVSCVAAAILMPRLPPLSRKKDEYYAAAGKQIVEEVPRGRTLLSWGTELAVLRARRAPAPAELARGATFHVFDIWFGLQPLVMVIGTVALAIAEYTPVFTWLSLPFVPLLELLRVPQAAQAAPAMLVGFADQFLPAILGQALESKMTRFVVACTAVTQLIYMSEVGALLLKSKLPLNLLDLFSIFLLRTLITVPICAGIAHLLF